jgi:hypothetical protein
MRYRHSSCLGDSNRAPRSSALHPSYPLEWTAACAGVHSAIFLSSLSRTASSPLARSGALSASAVWRTAPGSLSSPLGATVPFPLLVSSDAAADSGRSSLGATVPSPFPASSDAAADSARSSLGAILGIAGGILAIAALAVGFLLFRYRESHASSLSYSGGSPGEIEFVENYLPETLVTFSDSVTIEGAPDGFALGIPPGPEAFFSLPDVSCL